MWMSVLVFHVSMEAHVQTSWMTSLVRVLKDTLEKCVKQASHVKSQNKNISFEDNVICVKTQQYLSYIITIQLQINCVSKTHNSLSIVLCFFHKACIHLIYLLLNSKWQFTNQRFNGHNVNYRFWLFCWSLFGFLAPKVFKQNYLALMKVIPETCRAH